MAATVTQGHRTRLRPGAGPEYRETHSSIPAPLAGALASCGLVSWRIWIDGETLFHAIETVDGVESMVERMSALGPIDPAWDARLAVLVDDADGSAADLDLVWEHLVSAPLRSAHRSSS